jgi:hypothetical protein
MNGSDRALAQILVRLHVKLRKHRFKRMVKPKTAHSSAMIVADAGNEFRVLADRLDSDFDEFEAVPRREARSPGRNEPLAPSVLTMGQWLHEWLELCARRGLRPSTVASYETMILRCERDVDQSRR